jgi:hypothetical protein
MKDLHNYIAVAHLLDAQDITTSDTETKYVDLSGFHSAEFLVNFGAITTPGETSYITPILQESDTTADADFDTVDDDDILGAFTKIDAATEDQVTQHVGYRGSKRYVRVLIDVTNTGGGISHALVSVDAIVSYAKENPPSAPTTGTATS